MQPFQRNFYVQVHASYVLRPTTLKLYVLQGKPRHDILFFTNFYLIFFELNVILGDFGLYTRFFKLFTIYVPVVNFIIYYRENSFLHWTWSSHWPEVAELFLVLRYLDIPTSAKPQIWILLSKYEVTVF